MKTPLIAKPLIKPRFNILALTALSSVLIAGLSAHAAETPSCRSLDAREIQRANPGFICVTSKGVIFQKAPLERESVAFHQDAWTDWRTGKTWGERMGRVIQKEVELGGAFFRRNKIITRSEAVSLCENDMLPGKLPTLEVFMDALVNSGLEEILPAIRFNPNLLEYYSTSTPVRGSSSSVWAIDIMKSVGGDSVYSYRAAKTVRDVSLNEVVCVRDGAGFPGDVLKQ